MTDYKKIMPVSRPSLGEEELCEVKKVFDSHWLGMGSWVKSFEDEIISFTGAKNAIAVNAGTTALHLALDSMGVGPGDEVIVPSFTFAASVQAIMVTGATPVFCDIKSGTLNMDIDDVKGLMSARTKAIMPVHYGGLPCDMTLILEVAKKRKLTVVEDAAHAFGSSYDGKKIGSFGHLTCFSFDPIKNITCGEGGAITTGNGDLAELIRKKRILGIDKDTWSRYRHKREWFYNVTTLGFRYHMSNINAAIGSVQMKKVDSFIMKKRGISKRYDEEFGDLSGIELIKKDYGNIAPFNYVVKVKKGRDLLMEHLKKQNIDSGIHYIPNHLQPFFKKFRRRLPVTEKIWKEILTLPLYCDMSDADVGLVINAVKGFFK